MKTLFIMLSGFILALESHAMMFHQPLNDTVNLVAINNNNLTRQHIGVYSIGIKRQSNTLGLTRNIYQGTSWRTSLGLLLADESLQFSTDSAVLKLGNRSINVNDILSIKARLEFADIVPYVNVAYRYQSENRLQLWGFSAGLKLLKLEGNQINFD